jgi:hypothetical protein
MKFSKITHRFFTYLISIYAIGFFGCTSETSWLESYYFPLEALQQGVVYEYRPVQSDSLPPEYWYFRSFLTDTASFLAGQYINDAFEVGQFILEEKVSNGMRLKKCVIAVPDTSGRLQQIDTEVLSGAAFPFTVKDSLSVFLYQLKWNDPQSPGRVTTLTRNVRFFGTIPCEVFGDAAICAHLGGRELIAVDEDGVLELEYDYDQHFAEGIGLIWYRKQISEDFIMEYALKDTFGMAEFEERFGPALDPDFSL